MSSASTPAASVLPSAPPPPFSLSFSFQTMRACAPRALRGGWCMLSWSQRGRCAHGHPGPG
eukprot:671928-Rhodomonas_salina.1